MPRHACDDKTLGEPVVGVFDGRFGVEEGRVERLPSEEVGGGDVGEDVGAFAGGAEVRNGFGGEDREAGGVGCGG